ncbi:MAG: hypothetical protein IKC31_07860 [Clostridia bacterium]|nr:hypothetical protein [Clostridia bacterium]MBR2927476.1 hypothetical protein [Clostridia bacterium]
MSKVCKKCGVRYHNSARKCVMCRTEFNDSHIYRKRRIRIILAILAVLLLVSSISYAVYYATPQAAVRRIMKALERADVDEVLSYLPDFYLDSDQLDKEKYLMNADREVKWFSEQLYSFYLEDPMTPSEKEREELIEAFRYYGGEKFDESKLGDMQMIWVIYRRDIYLIWPKCATRFMVFEYDGRWLWWPFNVNR